MTPRPAATRGPDRLDGHAQRAGEHAGVQLTGGAIGIEPGARKAGGDEGCSDVRHTAKQRVHMSILGTAHIQS